MTPSNWTRYVRRLRLIRRAVRHGMNIVCPSRTSKIAAVIVDQYSTPYPELKPTAPTSWSSST